MNRRLLLAIFAFAARVLTLNSCENEGEGNATGGNRISHGPILGGLGSDEILVWARTAQPGTFRVRYGTQPDALNQTSDEVQTTLDRDGTGVARLTGLAANTKYYYEAFTHEGAAGVGGSFRTLPDARTFAHETTNPDGRFNFCFEYGSCNDQGPTGTGPELQTYGTMLGQLKDKVHFAILNGDFTYEEGRDLTTDQWASQTGAQELPRLLRLAPTLAGAWENYKIYLDRSKNLSNWHREVPSFFMFDDHELIDNVAGTGTPGTTNRKAVFRDIGTQGWYDYLGWANPTATSQPTQFGKAALEAGSDILSDAEADFTKLNLDEAGTLSVHWGTPNAGMRPDRFDEEQGDPNEGVYGIVEVLDAHRLRITPPARAAGEQTYSIGRLNFYRKRVANCDFFVLDTRSMRGMHDVANPRLAGLSMLGEKQKTWLKREMAASDAEFFFVTSTVNLMIPHVFAIGPDGIPTDGKDEAWTVFMEEREELINFWDSLGKPVMVMTGDLHNSFANKVTDRVWEFAAGPHGSLNHHAGQEAGRPPDGPYISMGRPIDIRWSTYFGEDVPAKQRLQPVYSVIQVNNVFNNPTGPEQDRWVRYARPQVIVSFHDGYTGNLLYSETIHATA
jgi:phosphodiesterase/alkaline phosphatase D-like protein